MLLSIYQLTLVSSNTIRAVIGIAVQSIKPQHMLKSADLGCMASGNSYNCCLESHGYFILMSKCPCVSNIWLFVRKVLLQIFLEIYRKQVSRHYIYMISYSFSIKHIKSQQHQQTVYWTSTFVWNSKRSYVALYVGFRKPTRYISFTVRRFVKIERWIRSVGIFKI